MSAPATLPRLYRDLAPWYPLLTPVSDYADEAVFYRRVIDRHARRPVRSLLDLGSGGGHVAAHLKQRLACTLVDVSPAMLALSERLNPQCTHVEGDMRTLRLGRRFDAVLVHDAVGYMTTRDDLAQAVATAHAHTAPGGVALFVPDFVTETFRAGTETGGRDGGRRALRYLEWRWDPDPADTTYVADMAYLLRDGERVDVVGDRHVLGLFTRPTWLTLLADAGFDAHVLPFDDDVADSGGNELFVGLRAA